jgi:syntaxin-binding protein 5
LDILWNSELIIPPRPTISNVEWITGTQHVTPVDLDMLSLLPFSNYFHILIYIIVGGPDRPPSKRMLEQLKSDGAAMQPGGRRTNAAQETYWEYMQRQITERTDKLGNLQDNMGKLEESSSSWATEAGKFVQKQKRNLVMGAVKSKFGI